MKRTALADGLNVMTLAAFALAQPLYDLLGRHSAFFVFHHSEPLDILLLVAVLSLLVPFLLAGTLLLLPGRRWTLAAALALLAALTLLPLLSRCVPAPAAVALALAAGTALTWCRLRSRVVHGFLLALSPALLAFPALFLARPGIARLLQPADEVRGHRVAVKSPAPVVVLFFDEFPLSSLLDERHQIDAVRYPNFAALARQAHWFRNATTVHTHTTHAIPALLTGQRSAPRSTPRWQDHPDNLFTLLAGSHELRVHEFAALCPRALNAVKAQPPAPERLRLLFSDLLLVQAHLLLPPAWTRSLPAVDSDWARFGKTKLSFRDRTTRFRDFLESLTPTVSRSGLYFLHLTLPHTPLCFLPSGKGYGRDDLTVNLHDQKNHMTEAEAVHRHQRHLLQVGYADRLLGEVIARLKEQGLFDDCVLVVTADHGCSFRPGKPYRAITAENRADILRVPLFIKEPGQKAGDVSDRNVQHVDVVPTIAHLLGAELPWSVEGQSALDHARPEPATKCLLEGTERWEFTRDLDGDWGMLGRKLELFGAGAWERLYRVGPHGALVGQASAGLVGTAASTLTGSIDNADEFREVSLESSFLPARVHGRVRGGAGPIALAVAVNGVVRAVVEVPVREEAETPWAAMAAEEAFQEGANRVELFEIGPGGKLLRVAGTEGGSTVQYRLDGARLLGSDGREVRLSKRAVQGCLDVICAEQRCVMFVGWAAETGRDRLPERIVMLADGEQVYTGTPGIDRPDVARAFGVKDGRRCGFNFSVPPERIRGSELRFFALSQDGEASELHYPEWYVQRGRRPF